jgi:hypothetical protein
MRTVLLALLLMTQQQAAAENDPKIVTLSCDGTVTDKTSSAPIPTDINHDPKPIEKMGVVVNLNERTVSFQGWTVPISIADAATINFNGEEIGAVGQIAAKQGLTHRIDGILDRVTGHMAADTMTYETKKLSDPNSSIVRAHYDVLCKATTQARIERAIKAAKKQGMHVILRPDGTMILEKASDDPQDDPDGENEKSEVVL